MNASITSRRVDAIEAHAHVRAVGEHEVAAVREDAPERAAGTTFPAERREVERAPRHDVRRIFRKRTPVGTRLNHMRRTVRDRHPALGVQTADERLRIRRTGTPEPPNESLLAPLAFVHHVTGDRLVESQREDLATVRVEKGELRRLAGRQMDVLPRLMDSRQRHLVPCVDYPRTSPAHRVKFQPNALPRALRRPVKCPVKTRGTSPLGSCRDFGDKRAE